MHAKKRISLDDLEKKPAFTVPEGYFDQLPTQISRRIQPVRRWSWITLPAWLRYSTGVAVMTLIALLGYWYDPSAQADPAQVIAEVPEKEIIEYLHTRADLSSQEWIETASRAHVQVNQAWLDAPDEELLLEEIDPLVLEEAL